MEKCSACGAPLENHRCIYCGANYQTQNQTQNQTQYQPQVQSVQPKAPTYQKVAAATGGLLTQVPLNDRLVNVYVKQKSKMVALLLCVFLGYLGAHKFYLGKTKTGLLYAFTGGLAGIGWFIDVIMILFGTVTDSNGVPIG